MILHGFIRTLIPLDGIYHKITVNKDKVVKKKNRKIKLKSNSSKILKGQKKKRKVERNEGS